MPKESGAESGGARSSPAGVGRDAANEVDGAFGRLIASGETSLREHARTALALQQERERYAGLFDFAPEAYVVTDRRGKITEANRAAEHLFGRAQRYLVGKSLPAFVEEADRRSLRTNLARAARLDVPAPWEMRVRRRGGASVEVAATAAPIYQDGGVEGLRWLLRDITAQKRDAAEIRRLNAELEAIVAEQSTELGSVRARLEAVVEQMPVGVLIMDADTEQFVLANRRMSEIWRHDFGSVGEVAEFRRNRQFRLDGRPMQESDWPVSRALRTGRTVPPEICEFVRGDGTRGFLEASAAPVRDRHGRVTGAVAMLEDVTERHSREQAEREFVTNAAHELQTPLAAITSAVEVLQAGAKEIPAHRDRFIGHVEREAKRLTRLSRALLVLARAQTGSESPRRELLPLEPVLRQTAAALRPADGVSVTVDCPGDLALIANLELVTQVLDSLGHNAAKFTREGSIAFRARQDDRGCVQVEVADTGPGIAPRERARIFERFYRGVEGNGDGFGLGLAIVKAAVEVMGGSVALDSRDGRGTVIRLRLPGATLVEP